MCDGVDAECEAAEDQQAGPGEFANKFCGYLFAVFGWLAGAGDGDDPLRVEVGGALVEEEGRGVDKREKALGIVGVGEEKGTGADLLKMAKLFRMLAETGEFEDGAR